MKLNNKIMYIVNHICGGNIEMELPLGPIYNL